LLVGFEYIELRGNPPSPGNWRTGGRWNTAVRNGRPWPTKNALNALNRSSQGTIKIGCSILTTKGSIASWYISFFTSSLEIHCGRHHFVHRQVSGHALLDPGTGPCSTYSCNAADGLLAEERQVDECAIRISFNFIVCEKDVGLEKAKALINHILLAVWVCRGGEG
jgi:hypothetical protein